MEGALLRSTLLTVAFAVAMFGIPMLVMGFVVLGIAAGEGRGASSVLASATNGAELLVAYVLFFALVAVVGAVLIARHQARRFSVPLAELAQSLPLAADSHLSISSSKV